MKKALLIFQYLFPKKLLSRAAGWLANRELGWVTRVMIMIFSRVYSINKDEMAESSIGEYKTFNAFFSRRLKANVRPLAEISDLVMPVDGRVSQLGRIDNGTLLQAKGHTYSLEALLAGQVDWCERFVNGSFATFYLAPKDYHRVHMPCGGRLLQRSYVPGKLFSVGSLTTEYIPGLFARNERVITYFETEFGFMAQILVGAFIVGSIGIVGEGCICPSAASTLPSIVYPNAEQLQLRKGEEMGQFYFGSTVINLFPKNSIQFVLNLSVGQQVKMGTAYASLKRPLRGNAR